MAQLFSFLMHRAGDDKQGNFTWTVPSGVERNIPCCRTSVAHLTAGFLMASGNVMSKKVLFLKYASLLESGLELRDFSGMNSFATTHCFYLNKSFIPISLVFKYLVFPKREKKKKKAQKSRILEYLYLCFFFWPTYPLTMLTLFVICQHFLRDESWTHCAPDSSS